MSTQQELLNCLDYDAWNDIDFKSASSNAPTKALKTVSAFANTGGGLIVFGVSEIEGRLKITGVKDVDRVQNEFLTLTRNLQKISLRLPILAECLHFDEGQVLCFGIPEAGAEDKPVHLNGDLSTAYIRKGASDYKCDREELLDFLRNSLSTTSYDSEPVKADADTFYDKKSLAWYRSEFEAERSREERNIKDSTFLKKLGFIVEHKGRIVPTRAAVLLFGNEEVFQRCLPKMVVDLHWYNHLAKEYNPIKRWDDREIVEVNLVNAWRKITEFFDKHSLKPYLLNPVTLQRVDDPPEQATYREAAINLLVHQDYGDIGRNAEIRIYKDKVEFNNPGNAFLRPTQLLIAGKKKTRNPLIVNAFRRIGLSEQAGSGVPKVFTNWRLLGYAPPSIDDDKPNRTFKLTFPKQQLIEDEQASIIEATGADLNDKQASVFAYLLRFGEVDSLDLMALTGLFSIEATEIADSLVKLGLAKRDQSTKLKFILSNPSTSYKHPNEISHDKTEGKVNLPDVLSEAQWSILDYATEPRTFAELMQKTRYSHRRSFRVIHLGPLIELKLVEMTMPEKPNSPRQKYVTTKTGENLRSKHSG